MVTVNCQNGAGISCNSTGWTAAGNTSALAGANGNVNGFSGYGAGSGGECKTTGGVNVGGSGSSVGNVQKGITQAQWAGTWSAPCANSIYNSSNLWPWSMEIFGYSSNGALNWVNVMGGCSDATASGNFVLAGALPPTITLSTSGVSGSGVSSILTTNGMPQLRVSNQSGSSGTVLATAVSSDGTSAGFPFPTINGGPLVNGLYLYDIANQGAAAGTYYPFTSGIISVGSLDTSQQSPLGLDAATSAFVGNFCVLTPKPVCTPHNKTSSLPIETLSATGQVCFNSQCTSVGSYPNSVKGYAYTAVNQYTPVFNGDDITGYTSGRVTAPSRAIVTNFGSNTVSIVDLNAAAVVATITVGTQPAAVALNAVPTATTSATKAYVVSMQAGTLTEIDLTANAISRQLTIGSSPSAVILDPSGTSVWVGGLNTISQVNLSSWTVVSTVPAQGQVVSVAISAGQSKYIYSALSTVAGVSSFQVAHANLATGASPQLEYVSSVPINTTYATRVQAMLQSNNPPPSPLPPSAWSGSGNTYVSASYGNRYVVSGTPTGFIVTDLVTNTTVLSGSTASAVYGLATDPAEGEVFVSAPDSNSLYSVPLPPQS